MGQAENISFWQTVWSDLYRMDSSFLYSQCSWHCSKTSTAFSIHAMYSYMYINLKVPVIIMSPHSSFLCPRDQRSGGILFLSCLSYSAILSFYPPLWNFNLANNFWTVSAIALIFHMNIPCDKTFLWECGYYYFLPCDLDLGVWPIFWKL